MAEPSLLEIRVADNGVGMEEAERRRLQAILDRTASALEPDGGDGGIGLINVLSRLRLFLQRQVRMKLENRAPRGLAVIISIPLARRRSMPMKALIVDDEKHVRDAIRCLSIGSGTGSTKFSRRRKASRRSASSRPKNRKLSLPTCACRSMTGSNCWSGFTGIPQAKTIVISGHDDFDFVRHTVKYGGMDYILKPIDADELNEALAKAVQSWRKEHEARRQHQIRTIEINQIKPVYWDKLFSGLVQEAGPYGTFAEHFERDFASAAKPERGRIAILSIDTMPRCVRDKFGANLDLLFFSLANIANEYCGGIGPAMRFGIGTARTNSSSSAGVPRIRWRNASARSMRAFVCTMGCSLDAGIGNGAAVSRRVEGFVPWRRRPP